MGMPRQAKRQDGRHMGATTHKVVETLGSVAPQQWPPQDGYTEIVDGWQTADKSTDWLYKPKNGMYFHTPTETLWKRSGEGRQRFKRIGAGDLRGGLAVGTYGVAGLGVCILLRACFMAWNMEVRKFETMEQEITEACEEARLVRPPVSAPRACERWPEHEQGSLSRFFGLFSWLPPQKDTDVHPQTPESPPALTLATLVRHNMRPTVKPAAAPVFAIGEHRDCDAIALVHKEREGRWRRHVRDSKNIIDDSCGLREGHEVVFGRGRKVVIGRAFPELDEYAVQSDGSLVSMEDGKVRYFHGDELTLLSMLD